MGVTPARGPTPVPTYGGGNTHETSHGRGRGFQSLIAHRASHCEGEDAPHATLLESHVTRWICRGIVVAR